MRQPLWAGSRIAGMLGAVCATLGMVLPSFLIISLVSFMVHLTLTFALRSVRNDWIVRQGRFIKDGQEAFNYGALPYLRYL